MEGNCVAAVVEAYGHAVYHRPFLVPPAKAMRVAPTAHFYDSSSRVAPCSVARAPHCETAPHRLHALPSAVVLTPSSPRGQPVVRTNRARYYSSSAHFSTPHPTGPPPAVSRGHCIAITNIAAVAATTISTDAP